MASKVFGSQCAIGMRYPQEMDRPDRSVDSESLRARIVIGRLTTACRLIIIFTNETIITNLCPTFRNTPF